MRLFEQFSKLDSEKLQTMTKSFFSYFASKIYEVTSEDSKNYSDAIAFAKSLTKANVTYELVDKIFDSKMNLIGYLYDIRIDNLYTKSSEARELNLQDILLLLPDKDGYFHFLNKKLYSPFVVFDKFLKANHTTSVESEEDINYAEFENENIPNINTLDLSKSIVLQGYYLAFLSILANLILDVITDKRSERTLEIKQRLLNTLSTKYGVLYFKYYTDKKGKYIAQKIPNFFFAEDLNKVEELSEPRKVVYPNEKVNIEKRYPHESHIGIVDLLETPESDKIGLTLTLVDSDDLEYDFEKLRIFNAKLLNASSLEEKLKQFDDTFLSLATKQIPFIPHSDAARMLMGSKNLKQAIRVVGAEEPIVKTGYEQENVGVNALVAYGLFKGLNFEDGIVVSESFAQKMKARVIEKEKYIVEVVNDKSPKIINGEWVYKGQKEDVRRIRWKVSEGESVHFGKVLFEVYKGKSNKPEKIYTYTGRYNAKIKSLPLTPEYPSESPVNSEHVITFYIEFEVEKPLEVGDKLMGRHGNKGTVSAILPDEEMPQVEVNGEKKTVEVILSPLGVVSRMNLGQLYETHISIALKHANFDKIKIPVSPLEKISDKLEELRNALKSIGADDYGRFKVMYGSNTWWLNVGYQYMLRLDHCVRDKIHVVSIANESALTNQPLKGRARNGGQRFGELEFWCLYSYANKNLTKLFAQKNLPESLKSDKRFSRLFRYPEERFGEILEELFGIRLRTENYMTAIFEPLLGLDGKNTTKDEDEELFRKYVQEVIVGSIRKNKFNSKSSYQIYRLYKFLQVSKQNDLQDSIIKFFEELKDILKQRAETSNEADLLKYVRNSFDTFKKTRAYHLLSTIDEFKELEKKVFSQTESPEIYKTIEIFVNNEATFFRDLVENGSSTIDDNIKERLMTKDGYLRNIVIARRLHYSGRTVISPMPLPRLDEYNVELDIDTAVIPVDFGITWFENKLIDRNIPKDKIENALKGDIKSRKEIANVLNEIAKFEDIYVLLNRQPSIHRHSLQAFRPIFWHNYTIGLPITVCEGFNADFDGDTMAVIYPSQQTEEIKEELRSMLPSRNPFRLGNGELDYSIDQDFVYGYYTLENGNKKKLREEVDKKIREYAANGEYDKIKSFIKEELINKYLEKATKENLTLTVFEIKDSAGSFDSITKSKCRGNDKQYVQLNQKIEVENTTYQKGFVDGLESNEYFDPEKGLVRRARRTLMDKKLKVADAGYFTRWLVEFLGTIQTSDGISEYIEHEIDMSKLPDTFDKKRFLYRWIKVDGKEIFVSDVGSIPDKFTILSPAIVEEDNKHYVSSKYCGFDVSRISNFKNNEYIGLSAGHVIGERGTQLSMETFHTGGKALDMAKVRHSIFKAAFESEDYVEFLNKIENKFKEDMNDEKVSLLSYLDLKSLYFELLYNYAQYLKNKKNIKSVSEYVRNFDLRGPLTCMSFESGFKVLEKIELLREYKETHPRTEYSFFWRWM